LEAFRQQHLGGRPLVLAGTSLGGTIAADYALAYPEVVKRLVLIDAQGFTSGVAPLPRPLAVLGVTVLRQIWLRNQANQVWLYQQDVFPMQPRSTLVGVINGCCVMFVCLEKQPLSLQVTCACVYVCRWRTLTSPALPRTTLGVWGG
jgi:hypothetical protein